ncbi:MAG: MOSC domain-containing protein [Myxococcales bacterium]|nr:MOSC domain-containing protein [Myxococcales bacterium]
MQVATIAEIHRYPVKSMAGERLDAVAIGADGVRGDRSWAARDEERGGIEGARKVPAFLGCAARFDEPVPETGALPVPQIELPDGTRLAISAPEAAAKLSELTGRTLTLWPRLPADDVEHYKRGAGDHEDLLEELRAIFGRLPDEPLPDIGSFPKETLLSSTLPGTYFDCYPLFLLTKTSLDSLAAAKPDSRFDPRRFRPNLLLDSAVTEGFPENEWVGRRLQVGEAIFEVAMECPRCVMTTHGFADLPKDPGIMRTLVKENGGNVGVYCSVAKPGTIREGDPAVLL